ncbi:MAG: MBL fold metallo-hydrolase [Lewinella sp.]|nr:MBL fold metallo-hydrolase [Lewinella sp.]
MIHTIDLHFQQVPGNIAAFLVETSEGPVLIETGPHSTLPSLRQGLAELGHRAEVVRHVFLTHIHLDHAGAAWWFARQGATIYVHPKGSKHLAGPERLMESARRIYQDQMDTLWGEMNPIPTDQIVEAGHEATFTIGDTTLQAWHTPGHAVHHIAWQIGDDLCTGDVAGVRINQGIVVPPCPPPDIQVEDWQKSIALLRQLSARRFYLTHFGPIDDLDEHLSALEARLQSWADWMKPHFEKQETIETITPAFEAMVRQELEGAGISGQALRQYELANPSWMSVAGLLRYWRKHTA